MRLISVEKYFIRWQVEVFLDDEKIFEHVFDFVGQPVLIDSPNMALGDNVAMLPAADELRRRHRCKVSFRLPKYLHEFAAHVYPEIHFVETRDYEHYATFIPNFTVSNIPVNPIDGRDGSISKSLSVNFGIEHFTSEKTFKPTMPPVTDEPYVCIAVQASMPEKGWLYPDGWNIIVDYLKRLGFRVFCIDKEATTSARGLTICKPEGTEDFTGNLSIMHRANMLYHAKFFIGLSSGLSWLANAVNCPVVMICGFSRDWSEFYTPWRVVNRLVCNGCVNDTRVNYFRERCPYHANTPREFECQKKIFPQQVIDAIERLIVDKNLLPPILKAQSSTETC